MAVDAGDDAAKAEADVQKIAIEAADHSYSLPTNVNDGRVEFTMENVG